jgi:hypothetical protein
VFALSKKIVTPDCATINGVVAATVSNNPNSFSDPLGMAVESFLDVWEFAFIFTELKYLLRAALVADEPRAEASELVRMQRTFDAQGNAIHTVPVRNYGTIENQYSNVRGDATATDYLIADKFARVYNAGWTGADWDRGAAMEVMENQ